jgi:hypothetical protein
LFSFTVFVFSITASIVKFTEVAISDVIYGSNNHVSIDRGSIAQHRAMLFSQLLDDVINYDLFLEIPGDLRFVWDCRTGRSAFMAMVLRGRRDCSRQIQSRGLVLHLANRSR